VLKAEVVGAGHAFHYAPGTVHRITALEDTDILEVSTPHLDDVVRLEDAYGREGTSAP
jgi:quercetin dioxygenase-like cupin family protein